MFFLSSSSSFFLVCDEAKTQQRLQVSFSSHSADEAYIHIDYYRTFGVRFRAFYQAHFG